MEEERLAAPTHDNRISPWSGEPDVLIMNKKTDAEQEMHPSRSPATSESSASNPSVVPSQDSTSPTISNPSSFADTPDLALRLETANSFVEQKPLSAIQETKSDPTLVGSKSVLPELTSTSPERQHNPPPTPTLWHVIKTNVKRPSGRKDSFGDESEGSPRKDKGRMGALFSGASKGLLSRTSSRSLAAAPSPSLTILSLFYPTYKRCTAKEER